MAATALLMVPHCLAIRAIIEPALQAFRRRGPEGMSGSGSHGIHGFVSTVVHVKTALDEKLLNT